MPSFVAMPRHVTPSTMGGRSGRRAAPVDDKSSRPYPTVLFRALPVALNLDVDEKRAIRQFAEVAAMKVAGGRSFTCVITNDAALRKLNREFLGHDYATDVLSFPYEPPSDELGDLAMSAERANAQAAAFGHGRTDEIRVLMLHGLLHLLGFNHEDDGGEMARAERKWRKALGLPSSLIARSAVSRSSDRR